MNVQNQLTNQTLIIFHTLICALLLFGILLLQTYNPFAYAYLITEDSWGENGTCVSYLIASFLIAIAIKKNRNFLCPGYVILCLGLFCIGMEEISWGQRLLNIRTPYVISQHNYQSELTLHNISILDKEYIFFLVVFIWAAIVPFISQINVRIQSIIKKVGVPLVPYELMPYFVLSFISFNFKYIIKRDEIGETLLGLAFVLFACDVISRAMIKPNHRGWKRKRIILLTLILIVLLTEALILAKPKAEGSKLMFYRMASQKYPQRGLNRQANQIFQHILKHDELKSEETLLHYGSFLKDMNDPKAETVLWEAYNEQKMRMKADPENCKPNRIAGKILNLLNKKELAKQEFQSAINKDQKRLANAKADWKRSKILRSIGETYIEMEDDRTALQYFKKAISLTNKAKQKKKINDLINMIENQ